MGCRYLACRVRQAQSPASRELKLPSDAEVDKVISFLENISGGYPDTAKLLTSNRLGTVSLALLS